MGCHMALYEDGRLQAIGEKHVTRVATTGQQDIRQAKGKGDGTIGRLCWCRTQDTSCVGHDGLLVSSCMFGMTTAEVSMHTCHRMLVV
jgi:hypothetical protein